MSLNQMENNTMEIEVKITPELDSGNTYPPAITFFISSDHITLQIEDRDITFSKTDIEKLVKLSNI